MILLKNFLLCVRHVKFFHSLNDVPYSKPESEMLADRVLEKLEISLEEWEAIMAAPNKTGDDYKNDKGRDCLFRPVKKLLGRSLTVPYIHRI